MRLLSWRKAGQATFSVAPRLKLYFTLRALGKGTVKGTSHYAVTKKTIDHKGYEGSQRNSLRESFV